MPRTDWRSPATYEGLHSLDAPGFAWEFLTRNAAFERDFERLEQASENGPLGADELTGFARRWGVRFCQARAWRRRSPTPVDAGKSAERDPDHSASN
jgi:Family of unknown function (DUF6499)